MAFNRRFYPKRLVISTFVVVVVVVNLQLFSYNWRPSKTYQFILFGFSSTLPITSLCADNTACYLP